MHAFLNKSQWPPNSPDLNPLDYFYWTEVEKNMILTPFMKADALKNEIIRGCKSVSKESIQKAISTFTSRVRAVENAKGNYLEKRKINKN